MLDDQTFRDMARSHAAVAPIRELRHALSQMRLADLAVGADGRNRCLLSPLRFKLAAPKTKIAAVPIADVERLLAACADDRYRAVILLATEAGLRAGEIRGLQWTDIKDGELTIRRQLDRETSAPVPPKHNKARDVPMSPRIVETLATLRRRGIWIVSCLDGSSLGYDGMLEAVHALYDRANVARPRKAMHCLRHTFGTEMAKRVPLPVLRDLMGHEDVATTMQYVDIDTEQKRDAIAQVFGVAAKRQQSATELAK
jgi:integrase